MKRYDVIGMQWRSSVDLHLPEAVGRGPFDLTLELGAARAVDDNRPQGRVLAALAPPTERPLYTFVEQDAGYRLRFHRLLDIDVDQGLDLARVHAREGVDMGYVSVLATGMLASAVLVLRGHPVLHASAVQVGGGALAFVGASGMGKSTLAAGLCRVGGRLITDDVLRLDVEDGVHRCRIGAVEHRLRNTDRRDGPFDGSRTTADGRQAVPARVAADRTPLRVLAVPYPRRGATRVHVEELSPRTALLELLRFPRIVGWTDPATTAAHFDFLADLVRVVRVVRVELPWSDGLDQDTCRDVISLLLPPGDGASGGRSS